MIHGPYNVKLIPVSYLILLGAGMGEWLLLLLRLQTIANGIGKCNAKSRVRVAFSTANPPHTGLYLFLRVGPLTVDL